MAMFMHVRQRKSYRTRLPCRIEDYHRLYRFTEENVEWLTQFFLGNYEETRGGALTSKKKMQILLRFLSDPGFQIRIGKEEGVERSTVCKTINYVVQKIIEKAHIWVKFPTENARLEEARREWAHKYSFPCAFGAIDGSQIRIQKPTHHGDEYCNRKGFCSINVQATCNAKEEFTSIDAQWPGSVHDNRILKRSEIYRVMGNLQPRYVLLGDVGYGITPWLLTPYKNPRTQEERAYNVLHKRERCLIERCFGQIKRRFPILHYGLRTKLDRASSIIICCAVLHNIAKHLNDVLEEDMEIEYDNDVLNEDEEENGGDEDIRRLGQQRREEIKNIIYQHQLHVL